MPNFLIYMKNIRYNISGFLNSGMPIGLLIGNRLTGKSFAAKKEAIRQFLKHGTTFIYMRRTEDEEKITAPSALDDVSNKFPDYEFSYSKKKYYISKKGESEKKLIGHSAHLQQTNKSDAQYHDVNWIIFDEFLPDSKRYFKPNIPDYEPGLVLSWYLSVARGYGKIIRDDVRFLCIGNQIDRYNPYFSIFNVNLHQKNVFCGNGVYAELFLNENVTEIIEKSKIGDVLKNTRYGQHALYNTELTPLNSDNVRELNRKNMTVISYVKIHKWYSIRLYEDKVYISPEYDEQYPYSFSLTDETAPSPPIDLLKNIKKYKNYARLIYSDEETKYIWEGIL